MKYMIRLGILGLALISLGGCVAMTTALLQSESAGYTGCAPNENEITNVKTFLGNPINYNATCKGKTYFCSDGHCAPAVN